MIHSLSLEQIYALRSGILSVMNNIDRNKHLIKSQDLSQLNNHLSFTLQILSNMSSLKQVEMADPYQTHSNIVYNQNGTTSIVPQRPQQHQQQMQRQGWESQFDESTLLNPPCYIKPPQSLTSISRINQARATQQYMMPQ